MDSLSVNGTKTWMTILNNPYIKGTPVETNSFRRIDSKVSFCYKISDKFAKIFETNALPFIWYIYKSQNFSRTFKLNFTSSGLSLNMNITAETWRKVLHWIIIQKKMSKIKKYIRTKIVQGYVNFTFVEPFSHEKIHSF